MWLDSKKIVVIGGTTGMGLSAATAFVREGAQVVVVGRNAESCAAAEEHLDGNGLAMSGDASDPQTAPKAIALCQQIFGGFDGLYHVAGGSGRRFGDGPLHELTLEGWNYTANLNLTSLMLSNQAAVRAFRAQGGGGAILNMGSVLGSSPSPVHFATHAYAAVKSAVIGFTKSIAAYSPAMIFALTCWFRPWWKPPWRNGPHRTKRSRHSSKPNNPSTADVWDTPATSTGPPFISYLIIRFSPRAKC